MAMIGAILCISLFAFTSQANCGWNGILPLHSTRAEVERILGPPTEPCQEGCQYDTKSEGVFVRYSIGRCSEGNGVAWNVPPNTVISLSINLEEGPKLSDLRLKLKRFKKTVDPELHGNVTYENEDNGVSYAVSADGRVYSIHCFATKTDDKALRCPAVKSVVSRQNIQESVNDPKKSVGWTFAQDKPRLDQFASNLKNTPDAKGFVIA